MKSEIILFCVLMITWVIFSGFIEPFFLISGAISCLVAVFITHKMDIIDHEYSFKPSMVAYICWLWKEIILSSIDVSKKMWQVKPDISPVYGFVRASQKTDLGIVAYANSITMTPGTICIGVDGSTLRVHALSEDGMNALFSGKMDKKITQSIE